jgi:drug/metabolite transporter (DMT)-like permease
LSRRTLAVSLSEQILQEEASSLLVWKEGEQMLSLSFFLLIWSVAGVLSATPTPLPASGPGVPSPDVGDPGIALLVLVAAVLLVAGFVLITVGVRSARATELAEDEEQKRLMQAELMQAPPVLADKDGDGRAGLPASG